MKTALTLFPAFQSALSQALEQRLIATVSREPHYSYSAVAPNDLLPRILDLHPNEPPAHWINKIRHLVSEASMKISVDQIPIEFALVSHPQFQPDQAWLEGAWQYLEASLHEVQENKFHSAKIIKNFEDREAWAVFADWLLERGDPRAELIHLELQLEGMSDAPEERKALTIRREDAQRELRQDFLDRYKLPMRSLHMTWHWCYLQELEFPKSQDQPSFDIELLTELLRTEESRFLRKLVISADRVSKPFSWTDFFSLPQLNSLTCLQLMDIDDQVVHALSESLNLEELTRLTLSDNMSDRGIASLARSPRLRPLTELDLSINVSDIRSLRSVVHIPPLIVIDSPPLPDDARRNLRLSAISDEALDLLTDWHRRTGIKITC